MNKNTRQHCHKEPDPGGGTCREQSTREQDQLRGLSVRQFAKLVGLGVTRCYREIQLNNIVALKSGSRTVIPTTEIEAFFTRLKAAHSEKQGGR